MTRLAMYPVCICVMLLPATAHANGLQALADFVAIVLLGAAVTFFFVLVLLIISAIIGRKNAPRRSWKRAYGWAAVVVGSLCELYLLPLAVTAVVILGDAKIGGGRLLMSGVILAALLGGCPLPWPCGSCAGSPGTRTDRLGQCDGEFSGSAPEFNLE